MRVGRGFRSILYVAVILIIEAHSPFFARAWQQLEEGLWEGRFSSLGTPSNSDPDILVLRIDPRYFNFRLLTSSEQNTTGLTLKAWVEKYGLIGAINASMYQQDMKTSTGFMKNYKHYNNPKINARFGAFMVFNPSLDSLPPVQIIDRDNHQDWNTLIKEYQTIVQNYRMISSKQENVWSPLKRDRKYSISCICMNKEGEVLFVHCASSNSVFDFNNILLQLPLNIYIAMYVEGGPESALYYKVKGADAQTPDINANGFLPIPNVIGIYKKNPGK